MGVLKVKVVVLLIKVGIHTRWAAPKTPAQGENLASGGVGVFFPVQAWDPP